MTLLELITRVRQRLDDFGGDTGSVPTGFTYYWESDDSGCLWKNDELVSYANASAMELAHRIPITDSSESEVARITLKPGVARYSIDPRVLAIDSVTLASTQTPLLKIHDAQERSQWSDPQDQTYADASTVQHYRDDLDALSLTVYATPTVADTLWMTVRRLPLDTLTWVGRSQEMEEFPPHLHEALINWMCMQALLKRDADTFDKESAGYFQGQFTDQVGHRVNFKHAKILKDVAGKRLRTRAYW
jgi:hypothetical protein